MGRFECTYSPENMVKLINKSDLFFQGGVILVSHDERLIRMICKELWVVQGGTVRTLEGGFEEYKHIVEKELDMNC